MAGMSRDLISISSKIMSKIPAGNYEGERLKKLKQNMLTYERFSRIGITTYLWNKLFKREKLIPFQMSVDNGISIGEDAAVTYPYLMDCDKVSMINNCDYQKILCLRRQRPIAEKLLGLRNCMNIWS